MTLRTYSTGFIVYGMVMILSDPRRWSAHAYDFMTNLMSQTAWGVVLFLAGSLGLLGSLLRRAWLRNIGLYSIAVYLAAFAWSVLQAALHMHTVSYGGAILFVTMAVALIIVAQCDERARLTGP